MFCPCENLAFSPLIPSACRQATIRSYPRSEQSSVHPSYVRSPRLEGRVELRGTKSKDIAEEVDPGFFGRSEERTWGKEMGFSDVMDELAVMGIVTVGLEL